MKTLSLLSLCLLLVSQLALQTAVQAQAVTTEELDASTQIPEIVIEDEYSEDDDNSDGALDSDDPTPRQMGERCGRKIRCAEGLDCYRAPLFKRCLPVKCGVQAVKTATSQSGFDLFGFGSKIMRDENITAQSRMFRSTPAAADLSIIDRDAADTRRLMGRMEREFHNFPVELVTASFQNCTKASSVGVSPYLGMSWELGALGTYNGDLYWGQGTNDAVGLGFLNNCFGFVLGYDAGISGLFGLGFTGTIADLQDGCKQAIPIAEFPPFGLQLGVILSDTPTFLMELTGGLSASTGLPGYTTCTTTVL